MKKEIYAELDHHEFIYSDELETCMLTHLITSPHWKAMADNSIKEIVRSLSHHDHINWNKIRRDFENFANTCALEIIDKRNKKEVDNFDQVM